MAKRQIIRSPVDYLSPFERREIDGICSRFGTSIYKIPAWLLKKPPLVMAAELEKMVASRKAVPAPGKSAAEIFRSYVDQRAIKAAERLLFENPNRSDIAISLAVGKEGLKLGRPLKLSATSVNKIREFHKLPVFAIHGVVREKEVQEEHKPATLQSLTVEQLKMHIAELPEEKRHDALRLALNQISDVEKRLSHVTSAEAKAILERQKINLEKVVEALTYFIPK